jgi:hypothetical protein
MATSSPNQVILRDVTVNGVSIAQSIRTMSVSSSIFSPFHSTRLIITDGSQVSDALYESGVPIRCVYTSGDGKIVREFDFLSHSNKGGQKGDNPKTGGVEIIGVSEEWFKLATEKHSGAYKNQPGTEVVKKIHQQVSKKSLNASASKGILGQNEPYHIRNETTGNAIHGVRNLLTHTQYNSGSYAYFMDNSEGGQMNLISLEQMMAEADGQQFSMKATTGAFESNQGFKIFSMQKMSSDSKHVKSQMQVGTKTKEGKNWHTHDYTPPPAQGQKIRDMNTPGRTTSQYQTQKPATTNYNRTWNANLGDDPAGQGSDLETKSAERKMKDIIQQGLVRVNVPIGGGLTTTVGKGINLDIGTESGLDKSTKSPDAGRALITASTDYIHMGDNGLTGWTAIDSSTGGRQG